MQHRGNRGRLPLPAKLTRPQSGALIERERLFELLGSGNTRRITWIAAPAGSGKTALASSWISARGIRGLWYRMDAGDTDPATVFHYLNLALRHDSPRRKAHLPSLTPAFLPNLGVFTRRYFEQLFAALGTPLVLVFDDCHEVAADVEFFRTVLPALLEALPADAGCVCLSREQPPPPLARHSNDSEFRQLGAEQLRFSDEEARHLADRLEPDAVEFAAACNSLARGWVTGLTLLLEATVPDRSLALTNKSPIPERLFEYLSHEVFDRTPPATQEVLVICALLDDIDANVLATLAERGAVDVIARLSASGYFVERRSDAGTESYRLHPLFREFLRTRLARNLSPDEIAASKARAARALEARGQLEPATELAREASNPELLKRLILAQAPALAACGRFATLLQWLLSLPKAIVDADGWLLYWLGLSKAVTDPPAGHENLERAHAFFDACGDVTGCWLAAANIIQGLSVSWSERNLPRLVHWVEILESLRAVSGSSLPPPIEAQLLMRLQGVVSHWPERPFSRHLMERAVALAPAMKSSDERYGLAAIAIAYLMWTGDESGALAIVRRVLKDRTKSAFATPQEMWFESRHGILLWVSGEHGASRQLFTNALERCRHAGLTCFEGHFLVHLVFSEMSAGDHAAAQRLLDMELAALESDDIFENNMLAARAIAHALGGRPAAAVAIARKFLASRAELQGPFDRAMMHCMIAVALLEAGDLDGATACAAQAHACSLRLPSDRLACDALFIQAHIALERDAEELAVERLTEALAIASARDFKNSLALWQHRKAARLLGLALRRGIQPDYVCRLIRSRKLGMPADMPNDLIWPVGLRIRALGEFSMHRDGEALGGGGHPQRRPLELLKALIGLGPELSLTTLSQQLWPELEGDAAHNACQVAIHRLRKLVGSDSVLKVHHGMASLDHAEIWVDVEVFRRVASRIQHALVRATRSIGELEQLARDLMTAYPGHFLPAEEAGWVIPARQQLRDRFVRLATGLSARLEAMSSFDALLDLNRHAIELDPLTEEFHRGAMQALVSMGRHGRACDVYHHCRELLMKHLRRDPTAELGKLYARALASNA